MRKPTSLNEYLKWAKSTLATDFGSSASVNLYNLNIGVAADVVSKHPFVAQLPLRASEWHEKYKKRTKSDLLMLGQPFETLRKSHTSAIDKSFRLNVLWNDRYPKAPEKGWITADNIYKSFNDGIRGMLACKFIDGPNFLVGKLEQFAKKCGVDYYWYPQAKDEGYYAYHFYTKYEVDLYDGSWNLHRATIELEIQITTQLQEILRDLTHKFYEARRLKSAPKSKTDWKWNYRENQFKASYLSHTLHLLEAYVVQSRDDYLNSSKSRKKGRAES